MPKSSPSQKLSMQVLWFELELPPESGHPRTRVSISMIRISEGSLTKMCCAGEENNGSAGGMIKWKGKREEAVREEE